MIAQQWEFTYRFPGYGGRGDAAPGAARPTRLIEFHVTSLDVIHSFWAYQLGVKADANPGVDNIAYVTTKGPLTFNIHCAELCGVWHGYMFDTGHVVRQGAVRALDRRSSSGSTRRRPRCCRRTRSSTSRTRRGEADEHGRDVSPTSRPVWRRLIGFNLLTGIVLGDRRLVHRLLDRRPDPRAPASPTSPTRPAQNDIAIMLGYLFGVVGFLVGLGFANYPIRRMLGHPPTLAEHEAEGEGVGALLPPVHRPQGRRRCSTSSGSACSSSSAGSTRC